MDKLDEVLRRAADFDAGRAAIERGVLAALYLDRSARGGRGMTEAQIAAAIDVRQDDVRMAVDVLREQMYAEALGIYWRITAQGILALRATFNS